MLVSFVDTMPPTLSQPADEAIEPCDQYVAPTVHATDAVDGDLTTAVERTGVYFYPNGISLSAIDTDANACPSSGRDSESFNFVDTSCAFQCNERARGRQCGAACALVSFSC